jgi:hypothetical protein
VIFVGLPLGLQYGALLHVDGISVHMNVEGARSPAAKAGCPWSEPLERDSSMLHTLGERSRKVERRKGKRYGSELRRQAVERMNACGNIVGLARELGVSRRALYQSRDRMEQTDSSPGRSRELILRKQILKLKRLLANKTLEVDFFRHALQRVGARRRQSFHPGDKASTTR